MTCVIINAAVIFVTVALFYFYYKLILKPTQDEKNSKKTASTPDPLASKFSDTEAHWVDDYPTYTRNRKYG